MRRVCKSVFLSVFIYSLFCGCRQPIGIDKLDVESDKEIKAIHLLEDEFLAAHFFYDGVRLTEFYTNEALIIVPDEPIVQGKQNIVEWNKNEFKKALPIENPTMTLEDIEVRGNLTLIQEISSLNSRAKTLINQPSRTSGPSPFGENNLIETGDFPAIYGTHTPRHLVGSSYNKLSLRSKESILWLKG